MTSFITLCVVFAAIWFLALLLSRHIQGLVLLLTNSPRLASAAFDLLVLPGVMLHELSHVIVALVLGIRVHRINLFQFRGRNDPRQGEVVVAKVDPLRMSIVGAAPLFGGVAALLLLVRWLNPPVVELDLAAIGQLAGLLRHWSTVLALYLMFAIANTMFPSEADRKAWWIVAVALTVIAAVVLLLGVRPELPPRWIERLITQVDLLVASLVPVIIVNVVCLLCVLVLEMLLSRLRGRRVVYHTLR